MGIKISKLSKNDKNKNNKDILLNYSNHESISNFENLIMFKLKSKLMEMYDLPVKNINYRIVTNGNQVIYQKSLFTAKKPPQIKHPELENCTVNYLLTFNNPKFLTIQDFDVLLNQLYILIYRAEIRDIKTHKYFSKPSEINCEVFDRLILKIIMSNDVKRTTKYYIEFLYILRDLLKVYPMYMQFIQRKKFISLFILCTRLSNLLLDNYSKTR